MTSFRVSRAVFARAPLCGRAGHDVLAVDARLPNGTACREVGARKVIDSTWQGIRAGILAAEAQSSLSGRHSTIESRQTLCARRVRLERLASRARFELNVDRARKGAQSVGSA